VPLRTTAKRQLEHTAITELLLVSVPKKTPPVLPVPVQSGTAAVKPLADDVVWQPIPTCMELPEPLDDPVC
jgi:hypothetical protein